MTFRARVIATCMIVALLPLGVFAYGARGEIRAQLTAQYQSRIDASFDAIRQGLEQRATTIDERLAALAQQADADPVVRLALLDRVDRSSLLDYAGTAMRATGLDYLVLLDSASTIISSGHFRNDYDRPLSFPAALEGADGPALVAARRPEGGFVALVRARAFTIGNRRFTLAGGIEVDSTFLRELARNTGDQVVMSLAYAGNSMFSTQRFDIIPTNALNRSIELPFFDEARETGAGEVATWTIAHSMDPLNAVLRRLDAWLAGAVGAAVLLAILFARVLAARVSRPLEELARQTMHVNLDRMDVGFATERDDEVGALSRMLDAMVQRLRVSASRLRAAERRATVGDMARQVNHDIRNGLLPIRNVIHHLSEVASDSPAELAAVFAEREGTLHGSITYLENLAGNYARLSPKIDRRPCDVNMIVRTVVRDIATADGARIRLNLSDASPRVAGDPVALRRIIENLTVNAIESLTNGNGSVTVGSAVARDERGESVVLFVTDTGSGMTAEVLEHVFDDFYTTKERGTGLGLSIVRRLVADMGGRIGIDSAPGNGTTFRIILPKAS